MGVHSKVKHDNGMWNRAAEGAEVGVYVIADKDGKRLKYDGPINDIAVERYYVVESLESYRYWMDNYSPNMAGFAFFQPPFRVNGHFMSEADAKKHFEEEEHKKSTGFRANLTVKYNGAKKFPDLGRAKQRVLYLVGYYNQFGGIGMLGNNFAMPAWTSDWFIWSATKDGEIIEPVLNCADYVVITQKYADLSKTYGIEAKEVFKKIEKADPAPVGVIIIGKFDDGDYYDDLRFIEDPNFSVSHDGQQIGEGSGYVFNSTELTAVKEIAKLSKIKKVGKTRAAFAVMSLNDAVMIKLAYTGSLEFKIIDMDKLEEMI